MVVLAESNRTAVSDGFDKAVVRRTIFIDVYRNAAATQRFNGAVVDIGADVKVDRYGAAVRLDLRARRVAERRAAFKSKAGIFADRDIARVRYCLTLNRGRAGNRNVPDIEHRAAKDGRGLEIECGIRANTDFAGAGIRNNYVFKLENAGGAR